MSNDSVSFIANVFKKEHVQVSCTELQPGQYVACIYETKWWIGNVCKVSVEEQDAQISFMHPEGPTEYNILLAETKRCMLGP